MPRVRTDSLPSQNAPSWLLDSDHLGATRNLREGGSYVCSSFRLSELGLRPWRRWRNRGQSGLEETRGQPERALGLYHSATPLGG